MTILSAKELRRALTDAGVEVFRVKDDEVHIAERQHLHLMEAGIRLAVGEPMRVTVTARAQQSDSPTLDPELQFASVRAAIQPLFALGYVETSANARELRSVSDDNRVVDVWYEIVMCLDCATVETAVASVQTALATERYIVASRV
ncbi:MAG: hypothetical protein Q8Q09_12090 [Deltaproteobacteria bacterium]|nr:hypothetical protein [Deltaproteobacteria bacterium]